MDQRTVEEQKCGLPTLYTFYIPLYTYYIFKTQIIPSLTMFPGTALELMVQLGLIIRETRYILPTYTFLHISPTLLCHL